MKKMGDREMKCRQLEKQRYWKELNSTTHQFFKILFGEFANHLRLPAYFMSNFREKLSSEILLRGPSGFTWPVRLAQSGDDWFFMVGWSKFVRDHSLGEHDLLIFRYTGNSSFKVEIFSKTGCEREGAYFVKAHTSSCSANYCAMQHDPSGNQGENVGETSTGPRAGRTNRSSKGPAGMEEKELQLTPCKGKGSSNFSNKKENLQRKHDSLEMFDLSEEEVHSTDTNECQLNERRKGKGKMEEAQVKRGDVQGSSSGSLGKKKYAFYLISNRREVSEEEKKKAFQSGVCYTSIRPNFLKVMKGTNVQKYFAVIIPNTWAEKHLPNTSDDLDVELRAPPNKELWPVTLKSTPPKLARGWYKFVMDNNLEKDDVCIFELSQGGKGKEESIIFDVLIHRVVNDVVSPTRVGNY